MSENTKALVQQIVNSIELIGKYTQSLSQEAFNDSPQTQDAVLHRIRVISHISKQISSEAKDEFSQISWKALDDLDNESFADGDGADNNRIWEMTQNDLPNFSKGLDQILNPPYQRKFGKTMFEGDDVKDVARNLLGCVFHLPNSPFPVKEGMITDVQWYDIEEKDPETTEDMQGDALMMEPGKIFFFEAMGHTVLLVSALSNKTRACVRINAVQGVADKAQMVVRALGITSFNREKYHGESLLDESGSFYITQSDIEVPEPEIFQPRHSKVEKGLRIKL